jgi:hypothetical protein
MPKEVSYADLVQEFKNWWNFPTGIVGYERLIKALMESGNIAVAKQVIGCFVDSPPNNASGDRQRCPTAAEIRECVVVVKAGRPKCSADCTECGGRGWRRVTLSTPVELQKGLNYGETYEAMDRCTCGSTAAG